MTLQHREPGPSRLVNLELSVSPAIFLEEEVGQVRVKFEKLYPRKGARHESVSLPLEYSNRPLSPALLGVSPTVPNQ